MKTKNKNQNTFITLIMVVVLIAGVFVFIRYTMNRTIEEPEVIISQGEITITGMYGESYSLSAITDLQLVEGTPQLGRKVNGAGLSSRKVYKGQYEVEGLGKCRVFLIGDEGLYIKMETEEETVLIMYDDSQQTIDLFEDLIDVMH